MLFIRTVRFGSFPDYLVISMRRFTIGDDWRPKKLGQYLLSFFSF